MKKIVLGSVFTALVAFGATGCIIESGDDGGDDQTAVVDASWVLHTAASNTPVACPPGITTAAFHLQAVDDNNHDVGQEEIDLFSCDAGHGTAGNDATNPDPLYADVYRAYLVFTSEGGSTVYTQTPEWPEGVNDHDREDIVDARDGSGSIAYEVLTDGGYFSLGWTLAGGTCASAGATEVGVVVTASGTTNASDEKFNCEAGFGITGGFRAGTYVLSATANAPDGALGAPQNKNGTITTAPNAVVDVGDYVLPVN